MICIFFGLFVLGTHWTYEIIKMLLNNTTELDKSEKAHTMLEAILDLIIMDALPSPRVLNTHLKFKYIPKKFIEDKGKIVHMIRNPKDVCVSSYYHAMKDIFTLIEGTFGEFYDKWLSGEGECRLYFQILKVHFKIEYIYSNP